jgi:hypothetical protein
MKGAPRPQPENPFEPEETPEQQDRRIGRMIRDNVDKSRPVAEPGHSVPSPEVNWIALAEDFLFTKYANIRGRSTLLVPILAAFAKAVTKGSQQELARAKEARQHTWDWYAAHYGKLEDWARKRLPEQWANEFFSCIANGTWGHDDVGPAYRCQAGFDVVPSGYVKFDSAQEQILHNQSVRAETAERELRQARERITELEKELAARKEE